MKYRRIVLPAFLLLGSLCLWSAPLSAQQAPQLSDLDHPAAVPRARLPDDIVAMVNAGRFSEAEAALRERLQADALFAPAHFLLGYVLFRQHRFTDSLAAYTAGAKLATPAPDDLLVVASDYIQLRDYADAARWLQYIVEHDAGNERAWYLLGRTSYQLDHPDEALHAFEQCLRLRPRDLPARYNAGLALERLQRPADAEAAYREAARWATESNVADPQPWLDLGNLLLTERRLPEAAEALTTAVQKAPDNPLCLQQLGVAEEARGNLVAAAGTLRKAIAHAPQAERAHFYLARVLKAQGNKSESDAEFAIVAHLHSSREGSETPNPDPVITPPLER